MVRPLDPSPASYVGSLSPRASARVVRLHRGRWRERGFLFLLYILAGRMVVWAETAFPCSPISDLSAEPAVLERVRASGFTLGLRLGCVGTDSHCHRDPGGRNHSAIQ